LFCAVYFGVQEVVLHEIGHCLGLKHSHEAGDVMSSFYTAGQTALSPLDVARVKEALA